mmetsp:Transcript_12544/g.31601  ORF Transcript_12544/g.31601 Transcript_12544/m.31601 type:complete len:81 (+) Transcript_12544:1153-1395(+)
MFASRRRTFTLRLAPVAITLIATTVIIPIIVNCANINTAITALMGELWTASAERSSVVRNANPRNDATFVGNENAWIVTT